MDRDRIPVIAVIIFIGLIGAPTGVAAQSPLEGVWEVQEWSSPNPGSPDIGLWIFHGPHYSGVFVQSDRPDLPRSDTATADQLRTVWGRVIASAGTFELTNGDTLTLHESVDKDPGPMAPDAFIEFRCALEDDGDTLIVTVVRTQNGPVPSEAAATTRYRRLE